MIPDKIREVLATYELGDEFIQSYLLPCHEEPDRLIDAGPDMFDRPTQMTPETFEAWTAMRDAAEADGVTLLLVSAFRSIDYQCKLIDRKLEAGQCIEDIFRVNAAPGFSEHHTGRALDLATPGCDVLEEVFENTPAFAWLQANASRFGFTLSYPRDNRAAIDYEPWHWTYLAPQPDVR